MDAETADANVALAYEVHLAATRGWGVLHTSESGALAHVAFERVLADSTRLGDRITSTYTAQGQQKIMYESGGWIRFLSRRSDAGRGMSADAIVVEGDRYTDDDRMAALLPRIASSKHPVLLTITPDE